LTDLAIHDVPFDIVACDPEQGTIGIIDSPIDSGRSLTNFCQGEAIFHQHRELETRRTLCSHTTPRDLGSRS
jgi:hypothetical protein